MGYGFCETGSMLPVSMDILVSVVVPMDVSSCANCESYSSSRAVRLFHDEGDNSWRGGLKVSDVTVSDIIFCKVTLLAGCSSV